MPNDMANDNALLKAFSAAPVDGAPDWFGAATAAGAEKFETLGLPTNRTEAWKYTNLRSLGSIAFAAPSAAVSLALRERASAPPPPHYQCKAASRTM